MTKFKVSKSQSPIISVVLILAFWLISSNIYSQTVNPDIDTATTQEKRKIQIALILDTRRDSASGINRDSPISTTMSAQRFPITGAAS